MEVLIGGREISDLPNEIQEVILDKLPTRDLLRCRLVSRLWKFISTGFCRTRQVKLRVNWFEDPNAMDIFTVFDPDDLPWSSFVLTDSPTGIQPLILPFVDMFGNHLWELRIRGEVSHSTLTEFLRRTPNLHSIDYLSSSSFSLTVEEPELQPVCLPKLKGLEFKSFDTNSLTFWESVISAPGLEILKIGCPDFDSDDWESTERVASLFANIPIIKVYEYMLQFGNPNSVLTGLPIKYLRIHRLVCCIDRTSLGDYVGFLNGLDLKYLEYLEIIVKVVSDGLKTPFTFRNCRALQDLKIIFSYSGNAIPTPTRPDYIRSIFYQMEGHQFPELESVLIFSTSKQAVETNFALFNPTCRFETVTKLILEVDAFLDDWSYNFPNIIKLDLSIRTTTRNLRPFLFSTSKLHSLIVRIGPNLDAGDGDVIINVMLWLAGIHDPASLNWESEEAVAKYRKTHVTSSILQLKALKDVSIALEGNLQLQLVNPLRDAAVLLTFLHVHKLDVLYFGKFNISEDCQAKLRDYHRDFQFSLSY